MKRLSLDFLRFKIDRENGQSAFFSKFRDPETHDADCPNAVDDDDPIQRNPRIRRQDQEESTHDKQELFGPGKGTEEVAGHRYRNGDGAQDGGRYDQQDFG